MNTSLHSPAGRTADIGVRSRGHEIEVESDFAETLITSRQNTSPRRLVEPGPSASELARILRAAAAAPDHGLLRPWRFVVVPDTRRSDLAEVFALALIDRDPGATLDQIEAARDKAHRAPLLMLVVARLAADEARIPPLERMVSVGCAVQNMLLMAHSLGLGSGLTSGQAMQSARMRELFQLTEGEEAACFINMGTVAKRKLAREHPCTQDFLSTL